MARPVHSDPACWHLAVRLRSIHRVQSFLRYRLKGPQLPEQMMSQTVDDVQTIEQFPQDIKEGLGTLRRW